MKKSFIQILFFISLFFVFSVVYADTKTCDDLKNNDAKEACKKIEDYCSKDEGGTQGCVYDPSNTFFTKITNRANYRGLREFDVKSATLTRGYTAVDKDGLAYFVGCYKYQSAAQGKFPAGTYFVFQFFKPTKKGKCDDSSEIDVVPADGIWDYDGQDGIGEDGATYYWKAVNNGNCPKIFALTANTTLWTADANKFVFADSANDLKKYDVKQFRLLWWNSEEYVINAGCTIQDKEGYEKAVACYDNAITTIKNKACPSNLSDISGLKTELEGLANKCSSDLEVLYKNELLRSNATTFKTNLTTAINEKLTACQYSQCNLTSTNITSLTNVLSTKSCKNGCAGKTGTEYETCMSCLKGAFNSCGLTSTQIDCLVNSQKAKDEAVEEATQEVEKDQEEHIEEELKEAQEIRETLYERYSSKAAAPPDVKPPEDSGKYNSCEALLGPNLTAIVKVSITILQIVGAIIAIVKGMMTLIPPILAKDADALKKAGKTLTNMAIILVIIFLFRPILTFIGNILDFDTSCIL